MEQKKQYTWRQRLGNWFYYNKLWVLVGVVILWVIGSMLWNVLGIGQTAPDYTVSYVGRLKLPQDCVDALENALAQLGEDLNGDGEVAVHLNQHIVTDNRYADHATYSYGAEITVLADITEGESHFFLLEDPVDFQLSFQVLANLDGSIPAEDDFEALNKVFRWADCPVPASLELGTYEDSYLDVTETGEIQDLLKALYLGRRYYVGDSAPAHLEAYETLWDILTEGATQ
jgi:sulfur carrier protein ThiS